VIPGLVLVVILVVGQLLKGSRFDPDALPAATPSPQQLTVSTTP
jgi:hypothetical protein